MFPLFPSAQLFRRLPFSPVKMAAEATTMTSKISSPSAPGGSGSPPVAAIDSRRDVTPTTATGQSDEETITDSETVSEKSEYDDFLKKAGFPHSPALSTPERSPEQAGRSKASLACARQDLSESQLHKLAKKCPQNLCKTNDKGRVILPRDWLGTSKPPQIEDAEKFANDALKPKQASHEQVKAYLEFMREANQDIKAWLRTRVKQKLVKNASLEGIRFRPKKYHAKSKKGELVSEYKDLKEAWKQFDRETPVSSSVSADVSGKIEKFFRVFVTRFVTDHVHENKNSEPGRSLWDKETEQECLEYFGIQLEKRISEKRPTETRNRSFVYKMLHRQITYAVQDLNKCTIGEGGNGRFISSRRFEVKWEKKDETQQRKAQSDNCMLQMRAWNVRYYGPRKPKATLNSNESNDDGDDGDGDSNDDGGDRDDGRSNTDNGASDTTDSDSTDDASGANDFDFDFNSDEDTSTFASSKPRRQQGKLPTRRNHDDEQQRQIKNLQAVRWSCFFMAKRR